LLAGENQLISRGAMKTSAAIIILRWTNGANEICVLRSPSPFILSPRRGNGWWTFLVWRLTVRQIQSREFSRSRRKILLLLGEKAGMREDVNHLKSECRMGNLSRRLVAAKLCEDGNQMKADLSRTPQFEIVMALFLYSFWVGRLGQLAFEFQL
jgi:hypothetical protein